MSRNYITGSYYEIILQNDIMYLYYGVIFMQRTTGMPGTSPEPPRIPGFPWHAPGTPGTPLGNPGTTLGTPGMPLGTLLEPSEDVRDPSGTQGIPTAH